MKIYVSIDGVIRNTIQKFDYHYKENYLNAISEIENFEYKITEPIQNDNLLNSYSFQSIEEFEFFLFMEYPIEIFGHAGLSYANTFTELNKLIHDYPQYEFTIIGMNELGKAKPATLFFLSKNGFLGDNIKFIKNEKIEECWDYCDVWITDNKDIVDKCPNGKQVIKFATSYNQFFTCEKEITKLNQINDLWSKSLENSTI